MAMRQRQHATDTAPSRSRSWQRPRAQAAEMSGDASRVWICARLHQRFQTVTVREFFGASIESVLHRSFFPHQGRRLQSPLVASTTYGGTLREVERAKQRGHATLARFASSGRPSACPLARRPSIQSPVLREGFRAFDVARTPTPASPRQMRGMRHDGIGATIEHNPRSIGRSGVVVWCVWL
jgi:hypothetical protein